MKSFTLAGIDLNSSGKAFLADLYRFSGLSLAPEGDLLDFEGENGSSPENNAKLSWKMVFRLLPGIEAAPLNLKTPYC
jgi:hypothetical protein